jgi:gluconokinase
MTHGAKVVLAIDLGSSSLRCSAYTYHLSEDLYSIALIEDSVQQLHKQSIPDGFGDADEILKDVTEVVQRCLLTLKEKNFTRVDAVSMASFAMNLVGVNETGAAVTRVVTYASEFAEPFVPVDTAALREHTLRTGTFLGHPSFAPHHMRCMSVPRSGPEKRSLKWQSLSCFIFGKWTGLEHRFPMSSSEAAWTGLLNVHSGQWDEAAVSYAGIDESALPPLASDCEAVSGLSLQWLNRTQWRELESALFIPGIADGLAANIASRCYHPSLLSPPVTLVSAPSPGRYHIAVTIGTSAAVRIILPYRPALVTSLTSAGRGLWVYRTSRTQVIAGGSLTDGGSLANWFSSLVGADRLQTITVELEQRYRSRTLLEESRPGVALELPMVLPFWSGERSTGWNAQARGTIAGLSHQSTPPLLLLALMEGVMVRLRAILDQLLAALKEAGESIEDLRIVISGSSLEKHWIWRQILADILDKEVLLLRNNALTGELTLSGVSEHAVETIFGGGAHLRCVWREEEVEAVCSPDQGHYRELFDRRFTEMGQLYELWKADTR